MASKTQSRRTQASKDIVRAREDRLFDWPESTAPLIGAALAGAAIGIAANLGRKFATQAISGAAGDWDDVLAREHELTLAIFDKMLATNDGQTWKRTMLLKQLTHALDKHAHQEEMVVYPVLREVGQAEAADALNGEHGYVKTYLYELGEMAADDSRWLDKVEEFRRLVADHAQEEEETVFPLVKEALGDEENARITRRMNRDGFWQA